MAFVLRGLEAGACLSAVAFLLGLAAVTWLPDELHMWQSFPIPRMLAILMVPVIAFSFSLFLSLITSCDPRLASQSATSGAAIAVVIALPSLFAVPLEALIVYAGSTGRLGTAPFVVLASLLDLALCPVFKYVEPNYVVGIRCLWTLRNDHVWADTHFFASCAFAAAGAAGLVLVFVVPPGPWHLPLIAGLFFAPTAVSVLYSYLIREEAQYIVR